MRTYFDFIVLGGTGSAALYWLSKHVGANVLVGLEVPAASR
ncbi:MAG: hypothetical protein AAGH67_11035 [Cyanobacteria bacterium P01_H01_bin.162]